MVIIKFFVFVMVFFFSSFAMTMEPNDCRGSVHARLLGLVRFGEAAQEFLRDGGELKDISRNFPSVLSSKIPVNLIGHELGGGTDAGEIYFRCIDLTSEKKAIQKCSYDLDSGKTDCENRWVETIVE